MKITDIKQQLKRTGRYSIFVDGKYSFSLSESELLNSGIKIGREYSSGEFDTLKQTALLDKAYMRSLDLLARRARSEWELHDYLKRKDYDSEVAEQTISKLKEKGYVDDDKFARSWVQSRHLLKDISKRKLRLELKQKRISGEVIDVVLNEDQTNERETLKELIIKKRQQSRYKDDLKLMQYLSRQGFEYGDIKETMDEI